MSLSRGQQGQYRILVDAAYQEEAARQRGELPPKEAWRRQLNLATTGHESTREMNKTADFDAVMLELAIMAMDEFWINRLATAEERRFRHIIEWFIYDLEFLKQEPINWFYIAGICKQAGYAVSLMDCPAEHLAQVLKMVDTHVRRLAKARDIRRVNLPSGYMRKGETDAMAIAKFRHDHHHQINQRSAA